MTAQAHYLPSTAIGVDYATLAARFRPIFAKTRHRNLLAFRLVAG